jgi:hypothetical protein
MKFVISTAALLLLLGTSASAYALQEKGQEEQKQQSKPAQKEAKPAQQQHQQAKPAQQQHQQSKPATHQQTTKPAQQHTQQTARTQQSQTRSTTRTQQTNTNRNQSRTQQTRASNGNNGNNERSEHGRITNEHYTASFGSEHRFHVNQGDYDHRRFDYGGYSFGFIDPWPMGWGYGDDVYVVYVDGGYYMYDVVHPGVRLSINIL